MAYFICAWFLVCMYNIEFPTADLKSVAKAVCGIDLTEHLVEFIIAMFDEDGTRF